MFVSFHILFLVSFGNEVTKISCHFQAKTVQLIFFVFGHFDKNTKNEKWNEPDFKGEILLQKHFESILTRISAPLSFAQQNFSLASFLLTRKKGGKRVFYWLLHYVLTPYTSMYKYIHSYVHILLSWHEKSKVLV